MDSRTSFPASSGSCTLGTTLHNATVDKAERNDFSNSRYHLLQRTGTPVIPLPPHDDYWHVPATISLPIPRELVERILLLLDTKSVLKSQLINREFNAIIQSSTLVQYRLACEAAGVIDNTRSPLSYAERLEALNNREDAWRNLKPVFETKINVFDQSSALSYELTAGIFFLWNEFGEMCIIVISLHPLMTIRNGEGFPVTVLHKAVNVISSEVGNQTDMRRHSLDLVLLKFSTGEYHPLARRSLIHVQRSASALPFTIATIAGDNIALVIQDQDGSKLFVFDWKTGYKRLQHKTTENAYNNSAPIFLSPELLLVPNLFLSRFEVWDIPSHLNPNPPVQILSLKIPNVSDYYSIFSIRCHGELSPILDSKSRFPSRPFFPSSENSIILVNIHLDSLAGFECAYRLIIHRRALVDMIHEWTSPSTLEQQADLPTWLTNEVTVHEVTDPDDGSVRLVAQSELVLTMLDPESSPRTRDSPTLATSELSPTSSTSHISANSSSSSISPGSASSTSRYHILQVQWADWGPPISRWFQLHGTDAWRTRRCNRQKYVFLESNPHDERTCMICVADFNPYSVRRNAEMTAQLGGESEDDSNNSDNRKEKKAGNEELELLDDSEDVFFEEVRMGLKCVVYHAPGDYDFDGVLMDEERLLGLKVDDGDRIESIKVLYFG